jgi:hypothetical protein
MYQKKNKVMNIFQGPFSFIHSLFPPFGDYINTKINRTYLHGTNGSLKVKLELY